MRIPKRRQRPRIEALEDRRVPTTWGIPWADPQHLTASFAPDGTSARGQATQLYQTLDAQLGAGNWEPTILAALQTWAANSNINIGLVADGGQALGAPGPAQGDARFGDIRISAEPLPSDVVAITTPYSPAYGTTSGDMILNSNDDFKPGDVGSYDLYTVALHEAGHVFGFADSADPSSFMYNVYQGPRAGLAPGAIPALQSLYGGARNIDSLDNIQASTSSANPVNIPNPPGNSASISVRGDLASAQQANYFALKGPNPASDPFGIDLQVQTSGISLLAPKVTVRDPFGNVVATAAASGPLAGGASVHLAGLIQGQNYTVQVQGATGDVFSVGSYDLTMSTTLGSSNQGNPTAGSQGIQEPGNYTGSTPLTVTNQVWQSTQADVYSFKTPTSVPDGFTVNLQEWGVGLNAPKVTVYDALNGVVGSATAAAGATLTASVRVGVALPNSTYFVRVENALINSSDFGTYQASVSFAAPASGGSSGGFVQAAPWFGQHGGAPGQANTTLNNAANLQAPAGSAPQSHYQAIEGISSSQSQQFFKVQTPHVQQGQAEDMTVSVQTLDSGGMLPWISMFDQNNDAVNAQVLTEQDGVAVIQVPLSSNSNQYVVEVSSAQAGGAQALGNFLLDVTFNSTPVMSGPLACGTLSAAPAGSPTAQASTGLSIGQGGLYSFVLAGGASNTGTDAILQFTLLDASGNVVTAFSTPAGLAASRVVCLAPGNYTILIGATSPSGRPIPPLGYSLLESDLTDPIKVYSSPGSAGASGGK